MNETLEISLLALLLYVIINGIIKLVWICSLKKPIILRLPKRRKYLGRKTPIYEFRDGPSEWLDAATHKSETGYIHRYSLRYDYQEYSFLDFMVCLLFPILYLRFQVYAYYLDDYVVCLKKDVNSREDMVRIYETKQREYETKIQQSKTEEEKAREKLLQINKEFLENYC